MKRRGEGTVVQAGGVVIRREGRRRRVLVIRSSDGLRWLFPKGNVERGESLGQAAAREVREEAGVVGVERSFVGRARFTQAGRRVEVYYYLFEHRGEVAASEERDIHWCTRGEARRLLSFEQLATVLETAWAAAVRPRRAPSASAARRPSSSAARQPA
jgi:8-oxo-dGTP pyrophosphatase MutT (NUDIX family)